MACAKWMCKVVASVCNCCSNNDSCWAVSVWCVENECAISAYVGMICWRSNDCAAETLNTCPRFTVAEVLSSLVSFGEGCMWSSFVACISSFHWRTDNGEIVWVIPRGLNGERKKKEWLNRRTKRRRKQCGTARALRTILCFWHQCPTKHFSLQKEEETCQRSMSVMYTFRRIIECAPVRLARAFEQFETKSHC